MIKEFKRETIVVKIGTSALTNKEGELDEGIIGNIVAQIVELKKAGHNVILVTSGAVAAGKAKAKKLGISFEDIGKTLKLKGPEDLDILKKRLYSGLGQPKLMAIYSKFLNKHGIGVPQFLATKTDFGLNGVQAKGIRGLFRLARQAVTAWFGVRIKPDPAFVDALLASMRHPQLLPILNENDMMSVFGIKFDDNDHLALDTALIEEDGRPIADRLIILSNVKGVETYKDSGIVIPVVNFGNPVMTMPESTEGTSGSGIGGMDSKMKVGKTAIDHNIKFYVASSRKENVLLRIMKDFNTGTRFTDTSRYDKLAFRRAIAPSRCGM